MEQNLIVEFLQSHANSASMNHENITLKLIFLMQKNVFAVSRIEKLQEWRGNNFNTFSWTEEYQN